MSGQRSRPSLGERGRAPSGAGPGGRRPECPSSAAAKGPLLPFVRAGPSAGARRRRPGDCAFPPAPEHVVGHLVILSSAYLNAWLPLGYTEGNLSTVPERVKKVFCGQGGR